MKAAKRERDRMKKNREDKEWNRDRMDGWIRTIRQIGPSPGYGQLE